jgi:rSAM/selenodomain-associated transferase 1
MKALVIFVKAPLLGRVKTRLEPHLAPDKIVKLYKSFVTEIISKCVHLRGVDKFIGCSPTKDDDFLKGLTVTYNIRSFNQQGKDLGEKIVNAFRDYLKKGYAKVVIIGSDSPTIPVDYIKKAFFELKKNDFVLGPCCDGGLYLVGAKRKIIPSIFHNIPWDTSKVLNKTLKKLNSLGIRFSMLPFWYDVDTIEDLRFLENHLKYLSKKVKSRKLRNKK